MNQNKNLVMLAGMTVACLLMLGARNAHAFSPNQFPTDTSGNRVTFGTGTVGGGSLGPASVTFASDGTVLSKGPVSTAGGSVKVAGELAAQSSKLAVAQAIGRFAFKTIGVIGAGVAVYELAKEINVILKPVTGGNKFFIYGLQYRCDMTPVSSGSYIYENPIAYCRDNMLGGGGQISISSACAATIKCGDGIVRQLGTGNAMREDVETEISQQAFTDMVAAKSGWPTSSRLGDAFKDALAGGESVEAIPRTVTGVPSTPPQRNTVLTPTGSTVTTTTNNYTYNGPTVTVVTVTTTQNYDKEGAVLGPPTVGTAAPTPLVQKVTTATPTGTSVTTTTNNYNYGGPVSTVTTTVTTQNFDNSGVPVGEPVVTTKEETKKEEDAPAVDSDLPAQPKLYKKVYPEGIAGVWKTHTDAMATSPLFKLGKDLMPTVGGGGSCPTMNVDLNFSQWANFGTKDVAPPCQVWDWGKAIIIVSSLLLARALIFGG